MRVDWRELEVSAGGRLGGGHINVIEALRRATRQVHLFVRNLGEVTKCLIR